MCATYKHWKKRPDEIQSLDKELHLVASPGSCGHMMLPGQQHILRCQQVLGRRPFFTSPSFHLELAWPHNVGRRTSCTPTVRTHLTSLLHPSISQGLASAHNQQGAAFIAGFPKCGLGRGGGGSLSISLISSTQAIGGRLLPGRGESKTIEPGKGKSLVPHTDFQTLKHSQHPKLFREKTLPSPPPPKRCSI